MQVSFIKVMEQYARQNRDIVSLSQGIPFFSSDARIRYSVIQSLLANKVDRYSEPQGILSLREEISKKLSGDAMSYTPKEILISAGSTEGMTATVLSLLKRDDEIIIPTPTYSAFLRSCLLAKLQVKELPLNEENSWKIDIEMLQKCISKKTKAILLCNPNNPTGSIYSKSDLDAISELATKKGLLLILDEVYRNMKYNTNAWYTPASNKNYKDNIVRIVSFSKDFALTGWRVGFLHSSKRKIEKILSIHDTLVNCAPVISQYAALAALEFEDDIVQEHVQTYSKHRMIMGTYLSHLSDYLTFMWPQASYFFFPKILDVTDSKKLCLDILQKEHVAVVPGSDFGSAGEGHIRLCFGRNEQDIHTGMQRLIKYFQ